MSDFVTNIKKFSDNNNDLNAVLKAKDVSKLRVGKDNQLYKGRFRPSTTAQAAAQERIIVVVKNSIALVEELESIKQKLRDEGKVPSEENLLSEGFNKEDLKQITQFENKVRSLFLKKLKPAIQSNTEVRDLLNHRELQGFLSNELRELRAAKKTDIDDPSIKSEEKMKRQMAKAKLAAQFGLIKSATKGQTGANFVEWVSKTKEGDAYKKIGIYKLSDKKAALKVRIFNFIKRNFFGQLFYLSKKKLAQSKSEAAAYQTSRFLGFPVAPVSKVVTLDREVGTMQFFLRDYKEAADIKHLLNDKNNFTEQGWKQFQQMTLFDVLLGNPDRHEENWFVKLDADGKIHEVKAIDNANSFPEKHFGRINKYSSRNQYKWQRFEISTQQYDPEILKQMRYDLSPARVDQLVSQIHNELPKFLSPKMEKLLRQRANVIYQLAGSDQPITPRQLAHYRTNQTIKKLLKASKHS